LVLLEVASLNIAILLTNREGAKGAKEDRRELHKFCQGCYQDFNLTSVASSTFLAWISFSRILLLVFMEN
jgi:hypothetical protein